MNAKMLHGSKSINIENYSNTFNTAPTHFLDNQTKYFPLTWQSCAKKSTKYFLRASAQHVSTHQSDLELVHIMLLTLAQCSEVHTSTRSDILTLYRCNSPGVFCTDAHTRTWKSTFQHARWENVNKELRE